jgi:hypothetical protein
LFGGRHHKCFLLRSWSSRGVLRSPKTLAKAELSKFYYSLVWRGSSRVRREMWFCKWPALLLIDSPRRLRSHVFLPGLCW